MKNPIIVYPMFGLSNRLATVSSAIKLADKLQRPLKIFWKPNYECDCTFESLFQKGPFEFIEEEEVKKHTELNLCGRFTPSTVPDKFLISDVPESTFCIKYCHWFHYKEIAPDFIKEMTLFNPVPQIQDEINLFLKQHDLNNMVGVHIRKSDKCIKMGENYSVAPSDSMKDKQLIKIIDDRYIEAMKFIRDDVKFFVCSDEDVQLYRDTYGDRIITRSVKDRSRSSSGIKEAVIDLWLLSKTKYIIRGVGTFGMCAASIRGALNFNIFSDKDNSFLVYYKAK